MTFDCIAERFGLGQGATLPEPKLTPPEPRGEYSADELAAEYGNRRCEKVPAPFISELPDELAHEMVDVLADIPGSCSRDLVIELYRLIIKRDMVIHAVIDRNRRMREMADAALYDLHEAARKNPHFTKPLRDKQNGVV